MTLRWRVVRWPFAAGAFGAGMVANGTRECVIVEARADDGAVGFGEAAPLPGRSRDTIADVVDALEALGRAASPSAEHVSSPAARFAIETALLGIRAAHAGCDLARLISDAAVREVRTAIVVGDAVGARAAYASGARCFKLKLGADLAAIAAAAPGARLRLDANRGWPAGEVAARLAALRALDLPIDFVEEPCAQLAQLIGTPLALPIALDESLADADAATLAALLAWPAVGAIVVKPTILGGIARCRELAARVAVPAIVSHALEGPIGTAACAELARALAGASPAGVGAHPALAGWRIAVPQLRGARVVRGDLPGLGFGALALAELP